MYVTRRQHKDVEQGQTDEADVVVVQSRRSLSPGLQLDITAHFSTSEDAPSILEPISISSLLQAPGTVNIISNMSGNCRTE